MKYSKMGEPRREGVVTYIHESQVFRIQDVRETKERILSYIFGLNAGGLVAGAAYLSAKDANKWDIWAVVLFGVGLLAAVIRATIDYFDCESAAKKLGEKANAFFRDEFGWEDFLAFMRKVPPQWHYYGLGFLSGICFFLGLIAGFMGIIMAAAAPIR
jgi:hypothetical protein